MLFCHSKKNVGGYETLGGAPLWGPGGPKPNFHLVSPRIKCLTICLLQFCYKFNGHDMSCIWGV